MALQKVGPHKAILTHKGQWRTKSRTHVSQESTPIFFQWPSFVFLVWRFGRSFSFLFMGDLQVPAVNLPGCSARTFFGWWFHLFGYFLSMEGFCGEREFYCALHDAVFNGKAKARFGERGGGVTTTWEGWDARNQGYINQPQDPCIVCLPTLGWFLW